MGSFDEIGGFDANKVEPQGDVVPAGEYDACIVASKWEPTKAGTGKMLKLQLQILNGPHQNRVLFDQLNLVNPNDKAVQIAKAALSSICRAVSVLTPKDSSELHNKPLKVKVTVQDSPEYGAQNRIKAYKPRHAQPGTTAAQPPSVLSQPQGATTAEPTPW